MCLDVSQVRGQPRIGSVSLRTVIDLRRRFASLSADLPGRRPAWWSRTAIGAIQAVAGSWLERPGFRTGAAAVAGGLAALIAMLVTITIANGGQHAMEKRPLLAAPVSPASVEVPLLDVPHSVYHPRAVARSKPSRTGRAPQPPVRSAISRHQTSAPAYSSWNASSSWDVFSGWDDSSSWNFPSGIPNWQTFEAQAGAPTWGLKMVSP